MMDFIKSIAIAASGMKAQSGRMRIISENVANADSTATSPGGDPYRRRIVTFHSVLDRELNANMVEVGRVATDGSDFRIRHEPDNPMANAKGDVKYPNVNPLVEMSDFRDAQRSYEANINVITATRRMLQRTLDILKT
jgi:flagellar basal-body rod protein FlgC